MKKYLSFAAALFLMSVGASAGTIIASGDSTIAYPGVPTGGNATFFSNLLGSGTKVLIQELDSGTAAEGSNIASYYNSLTGVTASQTTATSVTSLSGVNVFISMLPQSAYSAAELTAMSNLLTSGGTVFFIGESTGYGPGGVADPFITAALGSLGSTMTMTGNDGSAYPQTAITVANPLTAGVSGFTYGFTSFVSGGTALFDTASGVAFIEEQSTSSAPEPVTSALTLCGLAAFGVVARRTRKA